MTVFAFAFATTGFFAIFFLMTVFAFAFATTGFFAIFFLVTAFSFAFAVAGFFFAFARSTAPPLITRDVNDVERVVMSPADTFLSNGRISASITLQITSNTWVVSSSTCTVRNFCCARK